MLQAPHLPDAAFGAFGFLCKRLCPGYPLSASFASFAMGRWTVGFASRRKRTRFPANSGERSWLPIPSDGAEGPGVVYFNVKAGAKEPKSPKAAGQLIGIFETSLAITSDTCQGSLCCRPLILLWSGCNSVIRSLLSYSPKPENICVTRAVAPAPVGSSIRTCSPAMVKLRTADHTATLWALHGNYVGFFLLAVKPHTRSFHHGSDALTGAG